MAQVQHPNEFSVVSWRKYKITICVDKFCAFVRFACCKLVG